jgi:hypothetical protein
VFFPSSRALLRARLPLACVAATALAGTFAASAQAADTTFEAETMATSSTTAAKVVARTTASGGQALAFWTNSNASKTVTTPALSGITLTLMGNQCSGAPVATVTIDGTKVGDITVSETAFTAKTLALKLPAGSHKVEVAYGNEVASSTCDRNLYLDKVVLKEDLTAPATTTTSPTSGTTTTTSPTSGTTTTTSPTSGTTTTTSPTSGTTTTTSPTTTTTTAPAPAPAMSPLWKGDFETADRTQYYEYLGGKTGQRLFYDSSVKLQGNYSARFELRPGDYWTDGTNRNQLRAINGPNGKHYFAEGDNLYFRFALYIDPSTTIGGSFSNPWRALVAWPSVQDGAFSPLKYMLQRESGGAANPNGTDSLIMAGDLGVSGGNDKTQWALRNPQKGKWYEFITHWVFSSSSSKGLVEHWVKAPGETGFTKQTFMNGSQTMHLKTLSAAGATSNLRMGIYRNKAFTTNDKINYDNVYMGNTLASVGG